jgi:ferredoxin
MVFDKEDLKDPYYLARRKNTVLLSLVCDKPLDTCFCTSVGGGPSSGDGSDIRMVHLGNRLLLEALTEKGESLISSAKQFLKKPKQSDLEEKEKIVAESEKKVPRIKVDGIKENLEKGFNLPLWSAIAERCLGCGVCTYLCPTCYCFDITDEVKGEKGKRIRTWDSCQYPLFTLHASGHNPRPSKTERMRQRIMHKFFYAVENFGRTFCVGCGRCVRSCPVNLDLRESIELITGNKACVSTRK